MDIFLFLFSDGLWSVLGAVIGLSISRGALSSSCPKREIEYTRFIILRTDEHHRPAIRAGQLTKYSRTTLFYAL